MLVLFAQKVTKLYIINKKNAIIFLISQPLVVQMSANEKCGFTEHVNSNKQKYSNFRPILPLRTKVDKIIILFYMKKHKINDNLI